MTEFSVGSAIQGGWETFKKRPWFLIGAPLLALIIYVIISAALGEIQKFGVALAVLGFIVNLYVSVVYKMGATNFVLKAVEDTGSLKVMDYWHPNPFWKYIGAGILTALYSIAVMIPAFIIAGIIALIVYGIAGGAAASATLFVALVPLIAIGELFLVTVLLFVPYLVIDHELGPTEAISASFHMTKGHRWHLLGFLAVCLLLNIAGFICLFVGLLVTIPVTSLAVVHAYRSIEGKSNSASL